MVTHFFECTLRRLPRLALGGDGDPGAAQQARHRLRDGAAARRGRAPRPRAGCRGTSGCSPVTWASATCCRPRRRRPARPGLRALRRPGGRGGQLGARARPAAGDVPRGSRRGRPALVRRRARPGGADLDGRAAPTPAAAPAASTCRWPGRCGRRSASAATCSPPTTAGSVSADHGCGAHSEVAGRAGRRRSRSCRPSTTTARSSRSRSARQPVRSETDEPAEPYGHC